MFISGPVDTRVYTSLSVKNFAFVTNAMKKTVQFLGDSGRDT